MNNEKRFRFVFISSILLCFLLCGCFEKKGITMTPEEICDYMNANFKGDFELIDEEIEDDDYADLCTAFLKCSLFPEEIVVTRQGYTWGGDGGWWEIWKTNYFYFVYKNKMEEKVADYVSNWFGDFDYKIVNATDEEQVMHFKRKYKNLDDYLASPVIIKFYIVIDAHDEQIKTNATAKAKSVDDEMNNQIEHSLRLFVFLCKDDNFDSLTDEQIKAFDTLNALWF